MSVEVLEAQEQLQRARDNLRHVEEGIKKTAISSNLRFGDGEGGRGRPGPGRRLMGRLGGVQRFRADNDVSADEPPLKKSLSSVASRLGPLNSENDPNNDNDDDAPTLKSTVTLSQIQDRESASSIVNDTKTLNRSKRLFGSLLMGTLRQFKQEKEKTKSAESKQAEMWDKINQKEAEQVALTAADRRKLETAKDEVNQEIRLLEEKMELAEMKVRTIEERDTYAQFIRTKTNPSIYYQPKEYSEATRKALKESNHRVNKIYEARIDGYSTKIAEIERKLTKLGYGVEKQLEELSTVKIEKLTRTVANDRTEVEEKINNPETGIKVEVQLRTNNETEIVAQSDSEAETEEPDQSGKMDTSSPTQPGSRSGSPERNDPVKQSEPAEKEGSDQKNHDPRRKSSPRRTLSSPKKNRLSPRRKSRSPRKRSRSPRRRSRSPRRKSRSPRRKSRSPRRKSRSPRRSRSPRKESRSLSKKSPSPKKGRSPRHNSSSSPNKMSNNKNSSKRSRSSSPAGRKNGENSRSLDRDADPGRDKTSASSKGPSKKDNSRSRSRSRSDSSSSSSESSGASD